MKRRIVLAVDGGGIMGLIPAAVLAAISQRTPTPLWELFSLVAGDSVGAIISALIATGKSGDQILNLLHDGGPTVFKRRYGWVLLPKYSTDGFDGIWDKEVGADYRLAGCKTAFVCTSVSECDGRVHYFKSDDPRDQNMRLLDAVKFSFAAPFYFGGQIDEQRQTVWLDGDTGIEDASLLRALWEVFSRKWLAEGPVHILSLGCGHHDNSMSFDKARAWFGRNAREIALYQESGGLAHQQSIDLIVSFVDAMASAVPGLSFQRIDAGVSADIDKMDGVEFMEQYIAIGSELAKTVDYNLLGVGTSGPQV